jgi:DNA-binding SARP family transcriptional activator
VTARVQLCGAFVIRLAGDRLEGRLPGRQGRHLLAYLAVQPHRVATRDELVEALWPTELPSAPEMALAALLSKLRRALGDETIVGRSEVRLVLPADAFIDVEAARNAIHVAESQLAAPRQQGHWTDAYAHIVTARYISGRAFLRGEEAPWIDQVRGELEEIHLRALECGARLGLEVGGSEELIAERSARQLIERAPYRETGYCLLMRALERQGNAAEAMLVYERLRNLLRDDLGVVPSAEAQRIHARLLEAA